MQEKEATQVKQQTQTPSVGRIAHYIRPDGQHAAAIICKVWSPETVNLYVMPVDYNEAGQFLTSVQFGNGHGMWHWPEYVP